MDDRNQTGLAHWTGRSAAWTATAAEGLSTDDTFDRLLIEHAGIGPGDSVLDLGSGTGDPAITIGVTLAGEGTVTACDLAPAMLETARRRAANVGIGGMTFVAAEMSTLPFADACFDRVTCRFGLMFPADRVAAAREAHRVLRPGGCAAYLVWGPYENNPPFFLFRRAVAAALGETEGPPPPRHSLGRRGQVSEILEAAGFAQVEERDLRYRRTVDDLDAYIDRGLRRGYPDQIAGLDAGRRDALTAALSRAFDAYREDGVVRLPNHALLGLGRRI